MALGDGCGDRPGAVAADFAQAAGAVAIAVLGHGLGVPQKEKRAQSLAPHRNKMFT